MQRPNKNAVQYLLALFTFIALILSYLFAKGRLSPRLLGLFLLLAMAGVFAALVSRARSYRARLAGPLTRERQDVTRKLGILVIGMLAALLIGWLATSGQPMAPRLIGATISLLIAGCLVSLIIRAKAPPGSP